MDSSGATARTSHREPLTIPQSQNTAEAWATGPERAEIGPRKAGRGSSGPPRYVMVQSAQSRFLDAEVVSPRVFLVSSGGLAE